MEFITYDQLKKKLQISTNTLNGLLIKHKIMNIRTGKKILFDEAEVNRLIECLTTPYTPYKYDYSTSQNTDEIVQEYIFEVIKENDYFKSSDFKNWCRDSGRKYNYSEIGKCFNKYGYEKNLSRIDGIMTRGWKKEVKNAQ